MVIHINQFHHISQIMRRFALSDACPSGSSDGHVALRTLILALFEKLSASTHLPESHVQALGSSNNERIACVPYVIMAEASKACT